MVPHPVSKNAHPLPVGINPRVTFKRMFGETDSTERRFARLKEKQSLLDSVTEETAKLQRSLEAPNPRSACRMRSTTT